MKYTFKITDPNGRPIKPVSLTGTVAEHFANCVSSCIGILNGDGLYHMVRDTVEAKRSAMRTGIERLASGGRKLDPALLTQYEGVKESAPPMEQVVPIAFITILQTHPQFRDEWENPELEEFHQLTINEKTSTNNLQLFIDIINKIKIKGVGFCKAEVSDPEQKQTAEQKVPPVKLSDSELSDFYIHTIHLPQRTVKLAKKFYLPGHCLIWPSIAGINDALKITTKIKPR
jgi:hypothetical protein